MRFRLLVALPFSLLLVGILFASLANLVIAVEGRGAEADGRVFPMGAYESRCDRLRREIHALSHEVTLCELAPECHGSPLLCPVALDPRIDREYERLRDALDAQCGLPRGLLDFAWEVGAQADRVDRCGLSHDGWEAAARGATPPASYSF